MKAEVAPYPKALEWPRVRLGDSATKIGSGLTPSGGHASYVREGIPLIRSQNVHMGRFDSDGIVHITPEQDAEMVGSRVQAGDVLLNIPAHLSAGYASCPVTSYRQT